MDKNVSMCIKRDFPPILERKVGKYDSFVGVLECSAKEKCIFQCEIWRFSSEKDKICGEKMEIRGGCGDVRMMW